MNQTKVRRSSATKKRWISWKIPGHSDQYRFPSQPIAADVDSAKQMGIQGQHLSGRDFIQSTWGRVQAATGSEYARALLESGTLYEVLRDLSITSSNLVVVPSYGTRHNRHEPPISREKLAIALTKDLADVIASFDDRAIRSVVVKLSEMPENHAKFDAVRKWFEDIEINESTVTSTQSKHASTSTILERLEGFVEQIEGSIAYVRLTSEHGDELYGEYPAADLLDKGIGERQRFQCITMQQNGHVQVSLKAIPEQNTPAEEETIHRRIEQLLADDPLDGDY